MDFFEFFNNFNNYFYLNFTFSEELIIIFLFYNFIKIIIFSSVFELIWPTHFFNNRHNFNLIIKFRKFNETLIKLKSKFLVKHSFNKIIFYYIFKN